MSTTPEDNTGPEGIGRVPAGAGQPVFEPAVAEETGAGPGGPERAAQESAGGTGADAVAAGGVFSAETFALVGAALIAVTVLSGQLVELLTGMVLVGGKPIAIEQITQIRIQIGVGCALAVLASAASLLSLLLGAAGTRPWATWVAAAGITVGVLLMLIGAAAFLLIPEAAPPQPVVPPF